MNCETYRQIASARQDGEATHDEIAEFEHHLAGCADCRAWVNELVEDRERLLDWPDERPQRASRLPGRRTLWRDWSVAAAIAIVALGVGFAAGRVTATPGETRVLPESSQRFAFVEQQRTVYPARNEIHSTTVLMSPQNSD